MGTQPRNPDAFLVAPATRRVPVQPCAASSEKFVTVRRGTSLRIDPGPCLHTGFDILIAMASKPTARRAALAPAPRKQKPVKFCGSSLDDLRDFPKAAMHDCGYQIEKVQNGEQPDNFKPMPIVGNGVEEIVSPMTTAGSACCTRHGLPITSMCYTRFRRRRTRPRRKTWNSGKSGTRTCWPPSLQRIPNEHHPRSPNSPPEEGVSSRSREAQASKESAGA